MYLATQARIKQAVREFALRQYELEVNVIVNQPPRPAMGDMALPLAMELARKLRRPPRQIAEEIAAALRPVAGVAKVEIAGAGYVNLYLDRAAYATQLTASLTKPVPSPSAAAKKKTIVEHTNINPNKAAHIGHLRNAALGDTFVRLLRSRGELVEVQNYIDNTGVQVADLVVGFLYLERKTEQEVARMAGDPSARFDYYCWDLYASVTRFYEEDASRLELRARTLQEIEAGGQEAARVAEMVSTAIVRCHLATMLRLNVSYDLLPRESEILHLRFWEKAFDLLREKGAIYLETEGKNKGCWVMRQPGAETSDGDEADAGQARDPEDNKVIVRSNGTVTYVGKDIAYQLWKFGLLGKDFHYRPFHTYPNGHTLWVSSAQAAGPPELKRRRAGGSVPVFGQGQRVYNVIDVRQSYLQNIVAQGLRALGFEEEANRSIHFAYEMVALSPRCCAEMGIELSPEDRKRPYVEVSGRKGLGVKADDLIDRLIAEALREVVARHPDEPDEVRRRIATQIAIGALRYFLLKYTCNAVIAFDFREALSFEGETGPYVQYAVVRARNIFRKLEAGGGSYDPAAVTPAVLERFLSPPEGDPCWQLLLQASQWEAAAETAITNFSTSVPNASQSFAILVNLSTRSVWRSLAVSTIFCIASS